VLSANTLVRWVNENAFAPIVRARPCPTFGRPVRPWGSPHRLRPGTSPHTLRIPPRDGHPVLRSTSSGGFRSILLVSSFRLRAPRDFSIPSSRFGQRGITPAFGYGAPHPSAGGTSTLLIWALPSAHYENSDSCVGVVAFYDLHTPLARHAGLSALRASPSRLSVSNHLAVPGIALTPDLQRPGLPARHGSGLRQSIGGSPIDTAESSSSPTDCSFASGCSPRLLAAHAVASGFRMAGSPRVDLHLPDKARSRTHDGRPSPAMTR
jgi:hypothetical protein